MAYTQADLDQIDSMIKLKSTGKAVAEYQIGTRRVKYQDLPLADLQALRRTMANDLASTQGHKKQRYALLTTGKGL